MPCFAKTSPQFSLMNSDLFKGKSRLLSTNHGEHYDPDVTKR